MERLIYRTQERQRTSYGTISDKVDSLWSNGGFKDRLPLNRSIMRRNGRNHL